MIPRTTPSCADGRPTRYLRIGPHLHTPGLEDDGERGRQQRGRKQAEERLPRARMRVLRIRPDGHRERRLGGEVELGDESEDLRRGRECPATARPVRQVNGPGIAVEMNSEPARSLYGWPVRRPRRCVRSARCVAPVVRDHVTPSAWFDPGSRAVARRTTCSPASGQRRKLLPAGNAWRRRTSHSAGRRGEARTTSESASRSEVEPAARCRRRARELRGRPRRCLPRQALRAQGEVPRRRGCHRGRPLMTLDRPSREHDHVQQRPGQMLEVEGDVRDDPCALADHAERDPGRRRDVPIRITACPIRPPSDYLRPRSTTAISSSRYATRAPGSAASAWRWPRPSTTTTR